MRHSHDIPRRDVVLEGVPFKWTTNLPDDALLELYSIIRHDNEIMAPQPEPTKGAILSIPIHVFDKFVTFRDGGCLCYGVNNMIYAIYKTAADWELWAARQAELNELREEQEIERSIERERLRAEEHYLIEKCTECTDSREFDQAYAFLHARAELLKANNEYRFSNFLHGELSMRLASFPAKHCIEFLKVYHAPWRSYLRLCESKTFWLNKCEKAELKAILDAAVGRFPTEGMLLKEACLFWDRRKDYALACIYCELGIQRHLTDDTKGGFQRRLARLKKKSTPCAQDSKHRVCPRSHCCTMVFYYAAKSAEDAERIVAEGFNSMDCVTAKLPHGERCFVNQPGILVSAELDPSTGFAVEIRVSPNETFLRRHELITPVAGIRYYLFFISTTEDGTLRYVSDVEIQSARASGIEKWQHKPLVWFGKR